MTKRSNVIWTTSRKPCSVCGWDTFTSIDGGTNRVCDDRPCIDTFRQYAEIFSKDGTEQWRVHGEIEPTNYTKYGAFFSPF